jgi:hypothetical protein
MVSTTTGLAVVNILIFPHRGDPPPDQPGYERDPGNPYVFHLSWKECRHREWRKSCGGCGKQTYPWCLHYDKPLDRVTCHSCSERDDAQER